MKRIYRVMAVLLFTITLTGCSISEQQPEQAEKNKAEPLEIETVEPCTEGMITFVKPNFNGDYPADGNIPAEYVCHEYSGGGFRIINDGKNGEKIRIIVWMPSDEF